jgi:hypothetical protein
MTLVLDGADGVVFVADSQYERVGENCESFLLMQNNFRHYDLDPLSFPLVIQYNRRDCGNPIPVGTLERAILSPQRSGLRIGCCKGTRCLPDREEGNPVSG